MNGAIGRLRHTIFDCSEHAAGARFRSAVPAAAVIAPGARPLGGDHVFADPAGHPFGLISRPAWTPPVAGER